MNFNWQLISHRKYFDRVGQQTNLLVVSAVVIVTVQFGQFQSVFGPKVLGHDPVAQQVSVKLRTKNGYSRFR